jgi:DnaJ-class molecular chaperone
MSGIEIVATIFGVAFGFAAVWYLLGLLTTKSATQTHRDASEEKVHGESTEETSFHGSADNVSWQSPHWWEVLDIDPQSGWDEIRAAYTKKISTYHPDRFVHLGDDFRVLAQERAKRINEAYSRAKEDRIRT